MQANHVHVCPVGCGTPSYKLTMCMSVLWYTLTQANHVHVCSVVHLQTGDESGQTSEPCTKFIGCSAVVRWAEQSVCQCHSRVFCGKEQNSHGNQLSFINTSLLKLLTSNLGTLQTEDRFHCKVYVHQQM